ncbi:MAG: DUF3877 family protein [Eubacteriales bacterium]|nr:DUF3877 family protein [Eubacteriales bacterium]
MLAEKYRELENNVIDTLKEGQIKLGYSPETVRLYYPLESLNRFLKEECTVEQMEERLAEFAAGVRGTLGDMKISHKGSRFCLAIPPEGMKYVHAHTEEGEFLVSFIRTIEKHDCTIEKLLEVFSRDSKKVHVEEMRDGEFDYLVYFEDGIPDGYRYCITEEGCHMTYHRFSKEDYEEFGF